MDNQDSIMGNFILGTNETEDNKESETQRQLHEAQIMIQRLTAQVESLQTGELACKSNSF